MSFSKIITTLWFITSIIQFVMVLFGIKLSLIGLSFQLLLAVFILFIDEYTKGHKSEGDKNGR